MKVAILAGGLGRRLSDGEDRAPKALAEIGQRPMICHVMLHYAHFGFTDFVIALGHKGDAIRRHFAGRDACAKAREDRDLPDAMPWRIDLVDTGEGTASGGRIKALAPHLGPGTFMLTWCDGLADIDLHALLAFHRSHGRLATVTAVQPPSRFGHLALEGPRVTGYCEKPAKTDQWISAAFFVLEPRALDYIEGAETAWEQQPLARLAADGELMAYRHEGFWDCVDTPVDRERLELAWHRGNVPWLPWSAGS